MPLTERGFFAEWSAREVMGWHTKSSKPSSYYYDNQGRRVGTIRNWKPDFESSGQIWSFLKRMCVLGFHYVIYDSYNSKGGVTIIRFYKGSQMLSVDEGIEPCLTVLNAAYNAWQAAALLPMGEPHGPQD